jgi:cell division protein FtsB
MTKGRLLRELAIMVITSLALYHAGRSICGSIERQVFLYAQIQALKQGQKQSQEVNKDIRDGLANYQSSTGIERLARERLNLARQDEIIVRIAK